jgi:HEPN domain-containing protein
MTDRHDVLSVAGAWVEKAENDLRNAQHTLTLNDEECPFDTVCFHAQQCAEKYLKALLTLHQIEFPRTHDLTELVALLPAGIRFLVPSDELVVITPYAVEARYPGDWGRPVRADAVRAVQIARRVRTAVRSQLPDDFPSETKR